MHDAFAPGRRARRDPSRASSPGPSRPRSPRRSQPRSPRGEHLVAEAGTGTGKSLAYLLPALESGRRVVVATATKALQEQLLAKDVPAAARALGPRRSTSRVLKGRQNYLCRKPAPELRADAAARSRATRRPSRRSSPGSPRPRPATAPSSRSSRRRRSGPSSRSAPTAAPAAAVPLVSTCFAEAARQRAGEAELVIANHALYFADLAAGGGVLPEHDAVVFDEAHRLEETAATWLGGRVSRAGLRRLAADVERACREAARAAARPARSIGVEQRGRAAARGGCAAGGPPAAARDPGRGRARPRRRARRARRRRSTGAPRGSTSSRSARSRLAAAGRGAASSRAVSNGSSGPSPTRSPGRPSTSRASCADGSGTTGRPRSSSRRR